MEIFDIAFAFVWEYDTDFFRHAEHKLQQRGLTTFIIGDHNIEEITDRVKNRGLRFRFYLDRAWDVSEPYEILGRILEKKHTKIFNRYNKVTHAIDKASMHLEFISGGLDVPYSIILPPFAKNEEIFISLNDLAILGRPFIIKPCNTTGGGVGVVTGAETLIEVLRERKTNSDDKYIIQEKIYPQFLDGRRAWFRCFYAFGDPLVCWWDDQTHIYAELTPQEVEKFGLKRLFLITKQIAKISGLDFFSTEIALSSDNRFVVIDYVNDQCDLRAHPPHADGIPAPVVEKIIASLLKSCLKSKKRMKF